MQSLDRITELFDKMDPWDDKTWPRNIVLAKLYDDLIFENPGHIASAQWEHEYKYHMNEHNEGRDKYVPF